MHNQSPKCTTLREQQTHFDLAKDHQCKSSKAQNGVNRIRISWVTSWLCSNPWTTPLDQSLASAISNDAAGSDRRSETTRSEWRASRCSSFDRVTRLVSPHGTYLPTCHCFHVQKDRKWRVVDDIWTTFIAWLTCDGRHPGHFLRYESCRARTGKLLGSQ